MDGKREARKRETADIQMEKGEKDEHLKLLTKHPTILLYKIITKINCKTPVKKLYKNLRQIGHGFINHDWTYKQRFLL